MTADPTGPTTVNNEDEPEISGEDPTVLNPEEADAYAIPRPNGAADLRGISEYALSEKLGQGGMGVVYAAWEKNLCRKVAVKRLNSILAWDKTARDSFQAEAVVTGNLAHPNIIPVYSIVDEQEELAIAMKLIDGFTLQQLIRPKNEREDAEAERYDLRAKLQILISVCNAVRYAHSRNIIHRDIKSGNIMVGEFGEVLLLDWGLAVSVAENPEEATKAGMPHKSEIRSIEGTLQYMPPEMLSVDKEALGFPADVYMLGALLYEILTGAPPHKGRRPGALASKESFQVAPLPETVESELRDICTKALSPAIAHRYRTVLEFQQALTDYLRHGESRAACASGRSLLERASAAGKELKEGAGRTAVYDLFAGAVFSFTASRELWANNPDAAEGERQARLRYAETAETFGDFGLALMQIDALGGSDAETLRKKIADKELAASRTERAGRMARKTATAAALSAAITAAILTAVFVGAASVGRSTAESTKIRLVGEGREKMARIVQNAASEILLRKQLLELAATQFGELVEEAGIGPNRPLEKDSRVARRLAALQKDTAPYGIRFVYVRERDGFTFAFPEDTARSPAVSAAEESWYSRVKAEMRPLHTTPKPDPRTGELITASAVPFIDAEGRLYGAAALYSELSDILGGFEYPAGWRKTVKTEIVGATEERLRVYFSLDKELLLADESDASPATLIPHTPDALRTMIGIVDAEVSAAGVIEMTRDGVETVAGYASLPGTAGLVLISVPTHVLTATADEIEAAILAESRRQLVKLATAAGAVLLLLFAAAFWMIRSVR